jgi:hypothetical protein
MLSIKSFPTDTQTLICFHCNFDVWRNRCRGAELYQQFRHGEWLRHFLRWRLRIPMSWQRRFTVVALLLLALAAPAQAQSPYPPGPPPVTGLPDSQRQTTYTISGTTCACAVGFQLYGDSTDYQNWIEVWLNGSIASYNDPVVGWSLASPTGSLATISRPITDAVLTFNNPQTGTVVIVGGGRSRRTAEFAENTGVPARSLNQIVHDLYAIARETWDKIYDVHGRGLFFPPGNNAGPLPPPGECVNSYLTFGSSASDPLCVPTSGGTLPSGNVQAVGSEAALTASAITSYPNGVWRLDYATGIGAPPLYYLPSASACSLNAGAGDGGSQVPSSDGKCWLAKFGPEADLREWGADSTGSADSAPALGAAMAAVKAVIAPPGNFTFNSAVSSSITTARGAKLCGAGIAATVFNWPNANGGLIVGVPALSSGFTLCNISLTTSQAKSGTALTVNGANTLTTNVATTLENVDIRGADGPLGSDSWQTGIALNSAAAVSIVGGDIVGLGAFHGQGTTAISLLGSPPSQYTAQVSIFGTEIAGFQTAVYYGTNVQGVQISGAAIAGVDYAVYLPASAASLSGLALTGDSLACVVTCVYGASVVIPFSMAQNVVEAAGPNAQMIVLTAYGGFQIVGNTFVGNGGTGFDMGGGTAIGSEVPPAAIFADNSIFGFSLPMKLESTATQLDIHDNSFGSNNGVPAIQSSVANPATSLIRIHDNTGWNPQGPQSITPGSSPWSTTPLPWGTTYVLTGGAVSSVEIQTLGSKTPQVICTGTPCVAPIGANSNLVVTYSSAPTVYSWGW